MKLRTHKWLWAGVSVLCAIVLGFLIVDDSRMLGQFTGLFLAQSTLDAYPEGSYCCDNNCSAPYGVGSEPDGGCTYFYSGEEAAAQATCRDSCTEEIDSPTDSEDGFYCCVKETETCEPYAGTEDADMICPDDDYWWYGADSRDGVLSDCQSNCKRGFNEPICGNGLKEAGETCDDGNVDGDDSCSPDCKKEYTLRHCCGLGATCDEPIWIDVDEVGDDVYETCYITEDICDSRCESVICGDGIKTPGEECDLGTRNGLDTSQCSGTCKLRCKDAGGYNSETKEYSRVKSCNDAGGEWSWKDCRCRCPEGTKFVRGGKDTMSYCSVDFECPATPSNDPQNRPGITNACLDKCAEVFTGSQAVELCRAECVCDCTQGTGDEAFNCYDECVVDTIGACPTGDPACCRAECVEQHCPKPDEGGDQGGNGGNPCDPPTCPIGNACVTFRVNETTCQCEEVRTLPDSFCQDGNNGDNGDNADNGGASSASPSSTAPSSTASSVVSSSQISSVASSENSSDISVASSKESSEDDEQSSQNSSFSIEVSSSLNSSLGLSSFIAFSSELSADNDDDNDDDNSSASSFFSAFPECGNGVVESPEQCDDGNTLSGDGCSSGCFTEVTPPPTLNCGNGNLDLGEECDDGVDNGPPGSNAECSCDPRISGCVTQIDDLEWEGCRWPECGDGIVNNELTLQGLPVNFDLINEQCDDGNLVDGDGCSVDCKIEASSSSSEISSSASETVSVASAVSSEVTQIAQSSNLSLSLVLNQGETEAGQTQQVNTVENLVAAASICGDGQLTGREECDDSNRRDDDGCSSSCLLEVGICGDGRVQSLLGEQCEKSSHDASLPYACENCRFISPNCGDGLLDPGEDCDNGDQNSTSKDASCRPDCSIGRCGDGVLDSAEECDDGNRLNGDGCDRFCLEETDATQVAAAASESQNIPFGQAPNSTVLGQQFNQQMPYNMPFAAQFPMQQLPLAQLQPLIAGTAPVGDTGPAAVAVIGAGAAAGFSFMRRRK